MDAGVTVRMAALCPDDDVLRLTGPLEWICRTAVEQLGIAQAKNRTIALAEVSGGLYYV